MASRLAEVKTRAFDLDAEFDHMSTQGSWYKHIPLPTECVVVPCWRPVQVDSAQTVRWTALEAETAEGEDSFMSRYFYRQTPPEVVKAALEHGRMHLNGLVYGVKNEFFNFDLLIEHGGAEWLVWLEDAGYAKEAAHIRRHTGTARDWHVDPIIVELRRKEQERMRVEFKARVEAVRAHL